MVCVLNITNVSTEEFNKLFSGLVSNVNLVPEHNFIMNILQLSIHTLIETTVRQERQLNESLMRLQLNALNESLAQGEKISGLRREMESRLWTTQLCLLLIALTLLVALIFLFSKSCLISWLSNRKNHLRGFAGNRANGLRLYNSSRVKISSSSVNCSQCSNPSV